MKVDFSLDEWDYQRADDAHTRIKQLEDIVQRMNERIDHLVASHKALTDEIRSYFSNDDLHA